MTDDQMREQTAATILAGLIAKGRDVYGLDNRKRAVDEAITATDALRRELSSSKPKPPSKPNCPYEAHADDCDCNGMGGDR